MWVKFKRIFLFVCLGFGFCGILLACQVPVFRYALERWESDIYPVKVVLPANTVEAELPEDPAEALAFLKAGDLPANFALEISVDESDDTEPRIDLFYPRKSRVAPPLRIWSGPLTADNAQQILHSPTRTELTKRILSGESVVWVFMPSGNSEIDQEVRKTLDSALAEAMEKIDVPEGVVTDSEISSDGFSGDPEDIVSSGVPLKIDFSVLEMSRADPAESIFNEMFLHIESDLHEFSDAPMVFPVFGRGRALEPLIGKGINPDTILEYCGYLCGACSCEVKDQNPGMDLLVAANWDAAIEGSTAFPEKILPPLEGTAALTGAVSSSPETPPVVATVPDPVIKSSSPYKIWIFVIGAVLVALVIGSRIMTLRSSK